MGEAYRIFKMTAHDMFGHWWKIAIYLCCWGISLGVMLLIAYLVNNWKDIVGYVNPFVEV